MKVPHASRPRKEIDKNVGILKNKTFVVSRAFDGRTRVGKTTYSARTSSVENGPRARTHGLTTGIRIHYY